MIWKALTKDGNAIISVLAETEEAAKMEVERQLRKPGRQSAKAQWSGKVEREK